MHMWENIYMYIYDVLTDTYILNDGRVCGGVIDDSCKDGGQQVIGKGVLEIISSRRGLFY